MSLAILCSGQARQHAGMFDLTGDAPEAADLFTHAAALLGGRDPRDIVRTSTSAALHHNRTAQILCTLQALAAAAALGREMPDRVPDRVIVAGYSVGEVAAWSVAGLLDARAALDLVARRAEAMDAAAPPGDGLLFVRGLSRIVVDRLCERHDAAIAIVNPDDAFLIGGSRANLRAVAAEAEASHAVRVIDLPVEVAAHTKRLAAASVEFREALRHVAVRRAPHTGWRIVSGIDGLPVIDVDRGLDKLATQISHTVEWAACLRACREDGATGFLELGPGHALSEMVTAAYRDVESRGLEDFRSLDGARAWLRRSDPNRARSSLRAGHLRS